MWSGQEESVCVCVWWWGVGVVHTECVGATVHGRVGMDEGGVGVGFGEWEWECTARIQRTGAQTAIGCSDLGWGEVLSWPFRGPCRAGR